MQKTKECYKYYKMLRKEMDNWLAQSMRMDGPGPNGGGEDEANYALAWLPHYLITRNPKVKEHFENLLDCLAGWVERECLHGYEPEAEAHHGTEPFLLFLPRYIGMFPEDERAKALLVDAAHHIITPIDGIPQWYDRERNCFNSFHIGTRTVRCEKRFEYEVAEHFRFIHMALAAHRVTGNSQYLDWAMQYGKGRVKRLIDAEPPMPVLWDLDGNEVRESELAESNRHGLAGSGHHVPGDPMAGIENLLASGAIYVLGDLYLLSDEDIFKKAAIKIIEPLISILDDPYHDPAAAAIYYYRWTFQDTSYDDQIQNIINRFPEKPPEELAMVFPQKRKRREPGVGRRNDMIYWGEWSDDGSVKPIKEPSTAALTLAYQMTGDVDYAARAFRTAATRLMMARRVLRGGREHSDMGGAVCSVAAGHGRNWGQGAVTGCYGPLILGTREIQSKLTPLLEIKQEDRAVPEDVMPLVRPGAGDDNSVLFHNESGKDVSFSWKLE
ncbi:hypothetical protein GF312_00725 [Candidatus Poribacteria bacterium]|nr:hypothetical protein [Candidatus Poribacteria bacterium]